MEKQIETYKEIERSLIKKFRKPIWRKFTQAINDYDLIQEGDKIAVCISGGKDSMLLAKLMQELQRHGKFPFELVFLVMDPGYHPRNRQKIEDNAKLLNIPITIFESPIFNSVVEIEDSPCYLCARMRRGYLYKNAQDLGCNKIALGHHFDDVVETILMGMLYGAQIQTMMPKLHSTNFEGMELIRPMYLIKEEDILAWRDYHGLEFLQCACRFTENISLSGDGIGESKRQEMKMLMKQFRETSKHIEMNIFRSVENVNLNTVIAYKQDGVTHHFLDTYDGKKMKFRKTKAEDIPGIMRIIHQAQEYMKEQGIDQWQDGYPNEESFEYDIAHDYSYVMEENGKIIGTMAVIFDGEPTYDQIYEGAWKTTGRPYAAVHRVAVDAECKGRGIAGAMLKEVEKLCRERGVYSIKNDTHRDNLSMQRMQAKNGFEYCGIIYLEDGAERIASEKVLQ
ncbi:MAG: GNAT family N-acetyltransferase [Lachnospiraceae bacterium]